MANDSGLVSVLLPRSYVEARAAQAARFPEVLRLACVEALRPAPHDCTYCRLRRMRPRWLRWIVSTTWLGIHCARCGRLKPPGDYRALACCRRCTRVLLLGPLTLDWRWR